MKKNKSKWLILTSFLVGAIIYTGVYLSKAAGDSVAFVSRLGNGNAETFYKTIKVSDGYMSVGKANNGTAFDVAKGGADAIMAKTDLSGNLIWKDTFGGSATDQFKSVVQLNDGNLILVGVTSSTDVDLTGRTVRGGNDALIVKINNNGAVLWTKTFGDNYADSFNSVVKTSDGGFIVVGDTSGTVGDFNGGYNSGSNSRGVLAKFDTNGNLLSSKIFSNTSNASLADIIQTSDGGYSVVGYYTNADYDFSGLSARGSNEAVVMKLDASYNISWKASLGSTGVDAFTKVLQDVDGSIVCGGNVFFPTGTGDYDFSYLGRGRYDTLIARYSSTGSPQWKKLIGTSGNENFNGMCLNTDNSVTLVGSTDGNDYDFSGLNTALNGTYTVKVGQDGGILDKKVVSLTGTTYYDVLRDGDAYILSGCTSDTTGFIYQANTTLNKAGTLLMKLVNDSAAPTVSADKMENTGTVYSANQPLKLTVNDTGSGVKYFRYNWVQSNDEMTPYNWESFKPTTWVNYTAPVVPPSSSTGWYFFYDTSDNAGNTDSFFIGPFTYDVEGPNVSVNFPNGFSGWHGSGSDYNINATDSFSSVSEAYYALTNSGTTPTTWNPLAFGKSMFFPDVTGDYYVHYKVSDSAGNITQASVGPYRIDVDAPTFTYTQPDSNWHSSLKIHSVYSDAVSGISAAAYRIGAASVMGKEVGWTDFTASPTDVDLPEGQWYFNYNISDNAWNTLDNTVGPYKIDKTAPTVTFTKTSGSWDKSQSTSFTYSDSLSGIASAQYCISKTTTPATWINYTAGSNILMNASGQYYVHYKVTDVAGNIAQNYVGPFQVDITPPTTPTITASRTGMGADPVSVTINGSTDADSGYVNYQYSSDGGSTWWGCDAGSGATEISDGDYSYIARAVDVCGNISAVTQPVTFSIRQFYTELTAVTPLNFAVLNMSTTSSIEKIGAVKLHVASGYPYTVKVQAVSNLTGAKYNLVPSRIKVRLNGTTTYYTILTGVDTTIATDLPSTTGVDNLIDVKFVNDWLASPDTYNTQLKVTVEQQIPDVPST